MLRSDSRKSAEEAKERVDGNTILGQQVVDRRIAANYVRRARESPANERPSLAVISLQNISEDYPNHSLPIANHQASGKPAGRRSC